MDIHIIAFDADDTLWANESYFQETERQYCDLLSEYLPARDVSRELFATEMCNIGIYGYGIKSFTLSMIETAIRISGGRIGSEEISRLIGFGKQLLDMPVVPLPGVNDLLEHLRGKYKLVVATKGDLLDQQRKLARSGLQEYFDHVEIMSEKGVEDYRRLLDNLNCRPEHFLMIGNSIKSDILPVVEIGGNAIHVPFHVTWSHEVVEKEMGNARFMMVDDVSEVADLLRN